jgi:hypothetical protein
MFNKTNKNKLRDFSPQAKYTDRASDSRYFLEIAPQFSS